MIAPNISLTQAVQRLTADRQTQSTSHLLPSDEPREMVDAVIAQLESMGTMYAFADHDNCRMNVDAMASYLSMLACSLRLAMAMMAERREVPSQVVEA